MSLLWWFRLSAAAIEKTLEEVPLYFQFALLGVWPEPLPDEKTIVRFRDLIDAGNLSLQIMAAFNATLNDVTQGHSYGNEAVVFV